MAERSFPICGYFFTVSDARDEYNTIYNLFSNEAKRLTQIFENEYKSQCKSLADVANKTPDIAVPLYEQAANFAVNFLMGKGIYTYDTDRVKSELMNIDNFQEWYTAIAQRYQQLSGEAVNNAVGFADELFFQIDTGGPVGAYDGVHSAMALLGAAATVANNQAEIKRIYNSPETLLTFCSAIIEDIVYLHISCMKVLESNGNISFDRVSDNDRVQSNAIISNLFKGNIPEDKKTEIWFQALKFDPYNDDVYRYAYLNYRENVVEIDAIADYSGLDSVSIKQQAIMNVIDFAKVTTEAEAIDAKNRLTQSMNELGVTSSMCLDKINSILNDYEEKAKVYFRKTYPTRAESEEAQRQDNEMMTIVRGMNPTHDDIVAVYNQISVLNYDADIKSQYVAMLAGRMIEAEINGLSTICNNLENADGTTLLGIKAQITSTNYNQALKDYYSSIVDTYIYKIWAVEDSTMLADAIRGVNANDQSSINAAIEFINANGRTPYKQEYINALSLFNGENIKKAQSFHQKKNAFLKLLNTGKDMWNKMTVRNSAVNRALIPDGVIIEETPYTVPNDKGLISQVAGKLTGALSGIMGNSSTITPTSQSYSANAVLNAVQNNRIDGVTITKYKNTPAMEKAI